MFAGAAIRPDRIIYPAEFFSRIERKHAEVN